MLCRRVLHLYKKYSEQVIVYAVNVHQTNISYSNEVPVCKVCIIIWQGEPRQLYLPSIPYSLHLSKGQVRPSEAAKATQRCGQALRFPTGKLYIWKIGKIPSEVAAWENAFGKVPNDKSFKSDIILVKSHSVMEFYISRGFQKNDPILSQRK